MIKKLAASIREYKFTTALSPLFMIAEVVFEVLIPYNMADLIDLGIKAGDMAQVKAIGLKLMGLAVCSLICGVSAGLLSIHASTGFAKNLRHDLFEKISTFSFANIDRFTPSGLITRTTTDVTNIQMAFMMFIRMAVRSPMMAIFAMVMTWRISHKITVIFFIAVPILAGTIVFFISRAFPVFERSFKLYDKLNGVVQEDLRGIRVVKAFVRQNREKEKFGAVSGDLYKTFVKAETYVAFASPVMAICMYGCSIAISWMGAKLIVSSAMTTGQLTSVITYSGQILMNLMMLAGVIVMGTIAGAAARRVVAVLDEVPDIQNCEDPVTEIRDGSVVFENVSFAYGEGRNCLEDIDLDIKSGETIGVIGGTGSGKTSLVQLIPRLYDVRGGRVLVGGTDVRKLDLTTLRKNVAMVLQKNVLFSGTIRDNLRWGNENASDGEIMRACRQAQIDSFVEGLPDGLDYMIEQGGSNVSGGQRQRLCIARALLADPKILILDDSTSAVDTHTDSEIRRAFREDLPGMTKLIIAQRISSVQDADRIIVMDRGRINGVGTHAELLENNEIYKEVYDSQMKGGGDFDASEG